MMRRAALLPTLLLTLAFLPGPSAAAPLTPLTPEEQRLKVALTALVRQEEQALLGGKEQRFLAAFGPGGAKSDAAVRMRERLGLFMAWAEARGATLRLSDLTLRTPRIAFATDDRVSVTAVVSESFRYRYLGEAHEQAFGLGVRHYYTLRYSGDRLQILSDDFTAPARDRGAPPRPAPGKSRRSVAPASTAAGKRAAAYADRYCGAAPGCGNDGFANPRYANLNGDGGDCTNFISQVLKAGGLKEDGSWFYDRATAEGSRAWSNAQGLADHLAWAPWAHRLAGGDYQAIVAPTAAHPNGADRALRLGDLVSYVQHGDVVHTGVVTGFDAHGLPLVDAHYNDRYHTPWDLGWGQDARYRLWRIDYPPSLLESILRRAGRILGGARGPAGAQAGPLGTRAVTSHLASGIVRRLGAAGSARPNCQGGAQTAAPSYRP